MKVKRRKKVATRALTIDVRDNRMPEGRLTISSRTTDPTEFLLRRAAIYALLEEGEPGLKVIQQIRDRTRRIDVVAEKVHAKQTAALFAELVRAPDEKPQMLGATIDRFLTRVKAKQAEGTLIQYEGFCRGMEEAFGVKRDLRGIIRKDVPISDIRTEAAESWLHGVKDTTGAPWSASRQTTAHAVALQVWGLAIEADEEQAEQEGTPRTVTRNLFAKGKARVRPPRVRKTRVVFLSRQKAGRLLWRSRGRPYAVLMALGVYAGLRAGEAVNLRMGTDVRLGTMELAIQPREGAYRWRPKGDNSVREVPVSDRLARWIRAHIRQGFAGQVYLVHPAGNDRPISAKTRERWTVEAYKAAGIEYGRDNGEGSTFHTLRHTFASWLAQLDVQLLKIAALMGDTPKTVEETYAHLLPRDLRATVSRLKEKSR